MGLSRFDKAIADMVKFKEIMVLANVVDNSINSLHHNSTWLDLDDETEEAINELRTSIQKVSGSFQTKLAEKVYNEYREAYKEVVC